MRKILTIQLFLLSLLFASCSSDEPILGQGLEPSTREIPVNFNLSTDNEFSELKAMTATTLTIRHLQYFVYNESDGSLVKEIKIVDGDCSRIEDTLPLGKYRIAIIASNNKLTYDESEQSYNSVFPNADVNYNEALFKPYSRDITSEYFYKSFVIEVSTSVVTNTIVLERIIAKLQIVPTDVTSIPANVSMIMFCFEGLLGQQFLFWSQSTTNFWYPAIDPFDRPYSVKLTREELLKVDANNPASVTLFPFKSTKNSTNEAEWNFPIQVVYREGDKLRRRTLKSEYTLERNKILRLTGEVFKTGGMVDGSINVDDEWDSEVIETTFD